MKRLSILVFIVSMLFTTSCGTHSNSALRSSIQPPKAALPLAPKRFVLNNGITVLFLENDELPLVQGTLYLRGGSLWEPKDCSGCVAALGSLMRGGGAGNRDADELDKTLEKMSATISSSFGSEFGSVSFESLSGDIEPVMSIFSDVLTKPRFDESRFSLLKAQSLEGIRRRVDDADTVTGIALNQLLYGNSPIGRVVTSKDVQALTREKLISLHRDLVGPEGAIFAVSGNVSEDKVLSLAKKYLGNWKGPKKLLLPITALEDKPAPAGIYFIELPFVQSTIIAGQLGVPRLTPDRYAIEVFNNIFGDSGLSSSLAQRVRTESGNAYVVYGAIVAGPIKGRNIIGIQTKSESVGRALGEALEVLAEFQRSGPPDVKIKEAAQSILNSFIFRFDTPGKTVQRAAVLEYLKYPSDYDATYAERIAGISPTDILDVAVKRWNLDELVVVVAGDANAFTSLSECLSTGCGGLRKGTPIKKVSFNEKLLF